MSEFLIWPRMGRTGAEERFGELGLAAGPKIDLSLGAFDFDGVGSRVRQDDLLHVRDELTGIATRYGFNPRYGYSQEVLLDRAAAKVLDREFMASFRDLTPMRWAESGSREVWSWFSLALLPDLTHWRWKHAVARKRGSREGEWYKPRWIGSDLTRHTWARYWWRSVQFEADPNLIDGLNEHDFNHLLERADTIGANPFLVSAFGRELLAISNELRDAGAVNRREVFEDSARRMLRNLAYVDDAALDETETRALVDSFIAETRKRLG